MTHMHVHNVHMCVSSHTYVRKKRRFHFHHFPDMCSRYTYHIVTGGQVRSSEQAWHGFLYREPTSSSSLGTKPSGVPCSSLNPCLFTSCPKVQGDQALHSFHPEQAPGLPQMHRAGSRGMCSPLPVHISSADTRGGTSLRGGWGCPVHVGC